MKVLAIGAHFDDVELGCGATLARHAAAGDDVIVFVATTSGYVDPSGRVVRDDAVARSEGEAAARILGVSRLICGGFATNYLEFNDQLSCALLDIIERERPDIVFTHWDGDVHHDHQALAKATLATTRHVRRVLFYQSNWYDSGRPFHANFYVDVSTTMEQKRAAIRAHQSEYARVGEKWTEYFTQRHACDGFKAGVAFAEAFQIVKYLV
jgi:LmbE family N-acetylglucosaminyl deacetylase